MSEATLDPMPPRSLERHPALEVAGVYEREVEAPIDAVWENVFDWEHLPWLHAQAFRSIDLIEAGDWGWHAQLGLPGDAEAEIELVVDRPASRYVARTRAGSGAPGEIWTALEAHSPTATRVRVEFCSPPMPEAARQRVGEMFRGLYQGLWDQDDEMIQVRERAREARGDRKPAPAGEPVELGTWAALRARLPEVVEFAGHRFRIVEIDGRPVAHAVECPHWLGPLDGCEIEDGVVTCPWHGYRFEVGSGESVDGRGMRLRRAPRVEIEPETGLTRLVST